MNDWSWLVFIVLGALGGRMLTLASRPLLRKSTPEPESQQAKADGFFKKELFERTAASTTCRAESLHLELIELLLKGGRDKNHRRDVMRVSRALDRLIDRSSWED